MRRDQGIIGTFDVTGQEETESSESDGSCFESSEEQVPEPPDDEPPGLWGRLRNVARSPRFQLVVISAILLNTLVMALEADYPHLQTTVFGRQISVWLTTNSCFLVFFVAELMLRFLAQGFIGFFVDPEERSWNVFDFVVVSIGILDVFSRIVSPTESMSHFITILRVIRILRILRVLRLLKQFRHLALLAKGLLESANYVMWTFLLLFVFVLVVAIFCTNLIWHNKDMFDDPDSIELYWGGVITSALTLFQFLTLDDWGAIARQVYVKLPMMMVIFIVYIIFAAFVILSLLTGVMAEHMNEVRMEDLHGNRILEENEIKRTMDVLCDVFTKTGDTTTPKINQAEFVRMVRSPEFVSELAHIDMEFLSDDENVLRDVFSALDTTGDGMLSWLEFTDGLQQLRKGVTSRQVATLQATASAIARRLGVKFKHMREPAASEGTQSRMLEHMQDLTDKIERSNSEWDLFESRLKGYVHGRPLQ